MYRHLNITAPFTSIKMPELQTNNKIYLMFPNPIVIRVCISFTLPCD